MRLVFCYLEDITVLAYESLSSKTAAIAMKKSTMENAGSQLCIAVAGHTCVHGEEGDWMA